MKKVVKKSLRKPSKKKVISLKPRGVSKVVVLAVVGAVLLGGAGFFLWSQQSGGSLSSAVPFAKPALNPNCELNDPELCKFMNNWQVQENYTVATKSTLEGMNIESVYQMSGQDKYRMVSKQNGKEVSNIVSIGDTTYTLDYTDNKWWKYTVNAQDADTSTTENVQEQFSFDAEESKNTTKYTFVAKEACGDLQCFKYEVVSHDMGEMKQYMWFDDKEYLMRKMTVEGESGEKNESIFSYDKVTIVEPSPVKEGMPDVVGAGASESEMKRMMQEYEEQSSIDNASYPDYGIDAPVDDTAPADF